MLALVRAGGFSGSAGHPLCGSGGCAQDDAPPPLPGGYKVGEKVFFTGVNDVPFQAASLWYGQQGEVTGPATHESHKESLEVLFPGNKNSDNCYLIEVRRLPAASAATLCARAPHTRRCPRPEGLPRLPQPWRPPALVASAAACATAHGARAEVASCGVWCGRVASVATLEWVHGGRGHTPMALVNAHR